MNTVMLIVSSVAMQLATIAAAREGQIDSVRIGLLVPVEYQLLYFWLGR